MDHPHSRMLSRFCCIAWFGLLGLSLAALPHSSVTVGAWTTAKTLQTIFVETVIDDIGETPQSRRTHVPPDDAMYLGHTLNPKQDILNLNQEGLPQARSQAATEIVAQPGRLPLIKSMALGEISLRIGGNADNHRPSCIKRAFASAHADTVARPSSSRRLRSSRTSRCHSGDCTSPGRAHRLSQTLSRSRTFSATDIVSIEISVDMRASALGFSIPDCQNGGDQRFATKGSAYRWMLSRVCSNTWFGLSASVQEIRTEVGYLALHRGVLPCRKLAIFPKLATTIKVNQNHVLFALLQQGLR